VLAVRGASGKFSLPRHSSASSRLSTSASARCAHSKSRITQGRWQEASPKQFGARVSSGRETLLLRMRHEPRAPQRLFSAERERRLVVYPTLSANHCGCAVVLWLFASAASIGRTWPPHHPMAIPRWPPRSFAARLCAPISSVSRPRQSRVACGHHPSNAEVHSVGDEQTR
jgi:hypothetical protein